MFTISVNRTRFDQNKSNSSSEEIWSELEHGILCKIPSRKYQTYFDQEIISLEKMAKYFWIKNYKTFYSGLLSFFVCIANRVKGISRSMQKRNIPKYTFLTTRMQRTAQKRTSLTSNLICILIWISYALKVVIKKCISF